MESNLTSRFQYMKIGDSKSTKRLIDCGIPQEPSLGPLLLFYFYVNDLQFSKTLFANDALLALSDANLTKLEIELIRYCVTLING